MHEMALKKPSEELPNRVSFVAEENKNVHSQPDFPKPTSDSPTTPSDASKLKPSNDPGFWSVDKSTRGYFARNGFNQSIDDSFHKIKKSIS